MTVTVTLASSFSSPSHRLVSLCLTFNSANNYPNTTPNTTPSLADPPVIYKGVTASPPAIRENCDDLGGGLGYDSFKAVFPKVSLKLPNRPTVRPSGRSSDRQTGRSADRQTTRPAHHWTHQPPPQPHQPPHPEDVRRGRRWPHAGGFQEPFQRGNGKVYVKVQKPEGTIYISSVVIVISLMLAL